MNHEAGSGHERLSVIMTLFMNNSSPLNVLRRRGSVRAALHAGGMPRQEGRRTHLPRRRGLQEKAAVFQSRLVKLSDKLTEDVMDLRH